jgi:hypothetical protein
MIKKGFLLCLINFYFFVLYSQEDILRSYYQEIATSSEFISGNSSNKFNPIKWNKDVKIFVKGKYDSVAHSELLKVISELNELIDSIEIIVVKQEDEANLIAFFGLCTDYDKIEPAAIPSSGKNYGLAAIYDDGKHINRGSFYVDVIRCGWVDNENIVPLKKHIVREELTQSLGLLNDSMKYPESIFYEGWSLTTEFSELDKQVIQYHYMH